MGWFKKARHIKALVEMSNKLVDEANLCLVMARECQDLAKLFLNTLPGKEQEDEG